MRGDKEKICPIRTDASGRSADCKRSGCQWWMEGHRWTENGKEEKGQCAIPAFAQAATTSGSH